MNISYNSNALHKASSLNLQPEAIYQALKQGIRDEEPILAKRSINGNNFQWTIPNKVGEHWQQIGTASSIEQDAVMDKVRRYKDKAAQVLGLGVEEIDAIFSTPNDCECIYFCALNGQLRVFIVGWDFIKSAAGGNRGIVTEDTKKVKQEVVIRFVKDGSPASGVSFELSLPTGFSRSYNMPDNGMFRIGMIDVGLSFHININNGQIEDSFVIIKGRTIYEFDLTEQVQMPEELKTVEDSESPKEPDESEIQEDPGKIEEIEESEDHDVDEMSEDSDNPKEESIISVEPILKVIDIHDNSVEDFPVEILFPDSRTEHAVTDEKGECQLMEMNVGDKFIVTSDLIDIKTSFIINADQTVYVLKLDYAIEAQNQDIKVKVIDAQGKPVYPGRMALRQNDRSLLFRLLDKGEFYLSNGYFTNNVPIEVKLIRDGNKEYLTKDFSLTEGEKEYLLQLDAKDYPWWMIVLEWLLASAAIICLVLAYDPVYEMLSSIVRETY